MIDDDDDPLLFADEAPTAGPSPRPGEDRPWQVLVVDDDESVHHITRVVLGPLSFRDRAIRLLSAYSAAEAWNLLGERRDIALILLDVVMESEDAGLQLVRRIRQEAGQRNVRIILRTGQPGQAPEREIIREYDINDYKSKTELTAQKLFTATIAALRAYADMVDLERNRRALERVVDASSAVFAARGMRELAAVALARLADLLDHRGEALFCGRLGGVQRGGLRHLHVLAGSGVHDGCFLQPRETLPDAARVALEAAFQAREPGLRADAGTLYITTPNGHDGVVYLAGGAGVEALREDYIDLYCSRVASAFDNAVLHARLLRRQRLLEQQVRRRTRRLLAANAALSATQRRMQEELAAASALQRAILPEGFPVGPHYAGFAAMEAARAVGGDFYDIFPLPNGVLGFLIADTCGKGVPAAIFMAMSRTILESVASLGMAPADTFHEANTLLERQNSTGLFVTGFYGQLDPASGELHYACAGHECPLLRGADGTVGMLPRVRGALLGIIEGCRFEAGAYRLAPGDTLLLTTDGVHEATDAAGEQFGETRLRDAFEALGDGPVEALVRGVMARVRDFAGEAEQSDDITVVALRYLG